MNYKGGKKLGFWIQIQCMDLIKKMRFRWANKQTSWKSNSNVTYL